MLTERLALALLRVAVDRSPVEVRGDNEREWGAELHLLVASGRTGRALRYAASLAVSRQQEGSALTARDWWRAVRLVVLAPVLTVVLLALSLVGMGLLDPLSGTGDSQISLLAAFVSVAAVLLGLLGRWWAVGTGAMRIAVVVVPGFAMSALVGGLLGDPEVHVPGHAVFFTLLAAVLVVARRLLIAGRVRSAWTVGITGTLLAAEAATALVLGLDAHFVPSTLAPLDPAQAPAWFLSAYTGASWGLSPDHLFLVGDATEVDPYLYVTFAGLALGAVLGRTARPRPVAATH